LSNTQKLPPTAKEAPPRSHLGVRQQNLASILKLVHSYGSLTRSELVVMTGLNRSTVLDLVSDLESRALVTQHQLSGLGEVGRPSIEVTASDTIITFVVIPRLRELIVGVVGLGGKVLQRQRHPMLEGATPEEVADKAGALINELREALAPHSTIAGVGVAAPGQVRVATGDMRWAPGLGWRETPFADLLSRRTGLSVRLDNDASVACAAEQAFGAGQGRQNMIFLLGVPGGLGGGATINGELLRGNHGYAGELGHMRISDDSTRDYSGIPGTLEAMVRRDDLLTAVNLTDVEDDQLFEAIRSRRHEAAVSEVLDRQTHYLGRAIALLLCAANPEIVVLSGFLEILLELRRTRLMEDIAAQTLPFALEGVEIHPGKMGSRLLLVGTAELGFQELLEDPLGATLVSP
jgi:predicted NBD/HSP70 family sugar kinase